MNRRTLLLVYAAVLTLTSGCAGRSGGQLSLREPDSASRLRIAATAAAAGQTDIALSMYRAAAAAAPDNAEAQARLASMLIRVGQPDAAGETLTRALAIQPNDPTLLRWLGNLRLEEGFAEAALQIFDSLVARRPNDIASLNGKGVALDLLGRSDEALQTFRLAQAASPADLQTANNLAVSLLLDRRPAAARDVLAPLSRRSGLPDRVRNNLLIAHAALDETPPSSTRTAGMDADDLRVLAMAVKPVQSSLSVPASDATEWPNQDTEPAVTARRYRAPYAARRNAVRARPR